MNVRRILTTIAPCLAIVLVAGFSGEAKASEGYDDYQPRPTCKKKVCKPRYYRKTCGNCRVVVVVVQKRCNCYRNNTYRKAPLKKVLPKEDQQYDYLPEVPKVKPQPKAKPYKAPRKTYVPKPIAKPVKPIKKNYVAPVKPKEETYKPKEEKYEVEKEYKSDLPVKPKELAVGPKEETEEEEDL
jgi:hypothetical protein